MSADAVPKRNRQAGALQVSVEERIEEPGV